jgi:hypothetical protein
MSHKILLHLSILYEYQQFFQHRICFSIQPQLQLVNLHRNRRYFVIKLHTMFCLSYFLKTNITLYSIYQYFMSINSFFNTVSVSVALSTIMHLFVLFQLAVVLSVGLRLLIAHFVFVILSIGRGTISSKPYICIQLIENVIDLVNNSIVFLVITTSVQHHGDIRMNTTVDRP